MTTARILFCLLLCWGAVACSTDKTPTKESPVNPVQAKASNPTQTTAPSSQTPEKPEGADAIAQWLRAYHPEDLPTAEELRKIKGSEQGLMWHAKHGNPLFVRQRALMLLRHIPSPDARALLMTSAQNANAPGGLRAGAIRGLEGHLDPLQNDARDLLQDAARDEDLRISYAAIKVMSSTPKLRADLEDAAQDKEVAEKTRLEAQKLLQTP